VGVRSYADLRRTVLHNRGCWSHDGAVELCRSSRIEEERISTSSRCIFVMCTLLLVVRADADGCWHYGD